MDSIINDFMIVACASVHAMNIVVSEDEKSMLTENAARSLVTENRKSLNHPKVKGVFRQIDSKRKLKEVEIKNCKSFIGETYE